MHAINVVHLKKGMIQGHVGIFLGGDKRLPKSRSAEEPSCVNHRWARSHGPGGHLIPWGNKSKELVSGMSRLPFLGVKGSAHTGIVQL